MDGEKIAQNVAQHAFLPELTAKKVPRKDGKLKKFSKKLPKAKAITQLEIHLPI
jgi:hypothetical protein